MVHRVRIPKNDKPDIFTELNPVRHAENRRKVASLYSMSSLVPMEQNAVDCAKILVQKLKGFSESHTSFNLQGKWTLRLALPDVYPLREFCATLTISAWLQYCE